MPHISLKMLKGRTDEQKQKASDELVIALCKALNCSEQHISVSIEDYTPQEWQDVFETEITQNPAIVKRPAYNPKDLL